MQIYINDKVFLIEHFKVDKLEIILNEELGNGENVVSSYIVDGVEYFDLETLIESVDIDKIKVLKAIIKTKEEVKNEVIIGIHEYIANAIPKVDALAQAFYSNDGDPLLVLELFDSLNWICSVISNFELPNSLQSMLKINKLLPDFEDTFVQRDQFAIGDLLSYEVIPELKNIEQELSLYLRIINYKNNE
ncbi:hypothetical protein ACVBAX_16090 [Robertmurraya sp. GLU-23]